jgi:hypothetical protein
MHSTIDPFSCRLRTPNPAGIPDIHTIETS